MFWEGEALIINQFKHSESALIISFFAKEHVFSAYVKAATSKKNQTIYQIGNLINGIKKSRNENNLGNFYNAEIITNYHAKFITNNKKIIALKNITEMLAISLQTGMNYENLYQYLINYLNQLINNELNFESYIDFELKLLNELGYGLDLSKCSVTGNNDNLYYISPKTGHAISQEIGAPYHDKLFIMPEFLKGNKQKITPDEYQNIFNINAYFFNKHIFAPNNKKIPFSRNLLLKEFTKSN
jgi:DNA repair protein RecO (recombination protein O)